MAECVSTADKLLVCVVEHPELTRVGRLVEEFIEQGTDWPDLAASLWLNKIQYIHILCWNAV